MVRDFLREFDARIAEIHQFAAAPQWPDLERAAHSMKGLAALFGFPALAENFLAIEDGAEAQDAGRVAAGLQTLDAAAGTAARQLAAWLEAK